MSILRHSRKFLLLLGDSIDGAHKIRIYTQILSATYLKLLKLLKLFRKK
jgi:hypothetical protein